MNLRSKLAVVLVACGVALVALPTEADAFWGWHHRRVATAYSMPSVPVVVGRPVVVGYAPTYAAPVTTYYAPTTAYYAPAPVTTYYAPAPVTTYYAPAPAPVTTYYAPAAPVTTFYAPAPRVVVGSPTIFVP